MSIKRLFDAVERRGDIGRPITALVLPISNRPRVTSSRAGKIGLREPGEHTSGPNLASETMLLITTIYIRFWKRCHWSMPTTCGDRQASGRGYASVSDCVRSVRFTPQAAQKHAPDPKHSFGRIHGTCLSSLVTDRAVEAWYHPSVGGPPWRRTPVRCRTGCER